MERYEQCPVCGEDMVGDNYSSVLHCGSLDLVGEGFEADSGPIYCNDDRLPEYLQKEKEMKKMAEQYQCNGCINGCDTSCFVSFRKGKARCDKHSPGTVMMGIGVILPGLPTGFCRVGNFLDINIFDSFEDSQQPYGYELYNIPVWKHLDAYGNTLVRGLSPRINRPFLDIIRGNVLEKINCIEITKEHMKNMD